jgi:hypothetical protein
VMDEEGMGRTEWDRSMCRMGNERVSLRCWRVGWPGWAVEYG